ncbi:putative Phosphatidylinositol 4-kinase [Spironucleus salmonicida]|uniref:Phosphatidylinositol 4-kinase n=1 Tax=Spironucleus salmonicida TaxID=348837 RepID=V6LJM4_9EUKA|nr:putative Phosphatidylinositol 4-kinase [Spironucleus salmonicida]|eukprot:EST43916.1 Phosphatidylinositol 4-kinase, putative [Spironucleus salmonicida]
MQKQLINQDIYGTIYGIIPLGRNSGFIEVVRNSNSLDEIGNRSENFLIDYFKKEMTQEDQKNFVHSFAFSAISQYVLQFKDRHNGNIMIKQNGIILDIDFGFLLEIAPGGVFSIEKAPFKYTSGFSKVITDEDEFRKLFIIGMFYFRYFIGDVVVTLKEVCGIIPCLKNVDSLRKLQDRLYIDLNIQEFIKKCEQLIDESKENIASVLYDKFQARQNEINY